MKAGSPEHWKHAPEGAFAWMIDHGGKGWWSCVQVRNGVWWTWSDKDATGATYDGDWKNSLMLRPTAEHELGVMVREMDKSGTTEIQIRKQHAIAYPTTPYMQDIMLDLETMGKGPNAAIVAIGAVWFRPHLPGSFSGIGEKFYRAVDLASHIAMGGQVDGDTVAWWMRQSEEARAVMKDNSRVGLIEALNDFKAFISPQGRSDEVRIWGNGASFDNVILSSAYELAGLSRPWQYWNDRCYRTLAAMNPQVTADPRSGVHHNALDDAIHQAKHASKIMQMGGGE